MIKVCVRAIVPTEDSYLLMGGLDKDGKETWDLPGGELRPGIDVKQHLRKLVLDNTGYVITDLHFFEVTCKVIPRSRGIEPATTLDFIFTSKLESASPMESARQTDLLRFENFEWLESGGRYRSNKVMALLTRYHGNAIRRGDEARLKVEPQES